MKSLKKDKLQVEIFDNRVLMGEKAAKDAAEYINQALKEKDELNVIFGAAPSQDDVISSLLTHDIDWSRINAFHMDEYVGIDPSAPQSFVNFLTGRIWSKVKFKSLNYLQDKAGKDSKTVCEEYTKLLKANPIDITFMGIGENGHIAFNDPHVAFFDDKEIVKVVDMDEACRQQQVNDGCFATLDLVPKYAYTLTIPTLLSAKRIFCVVPTKLKAKAVGATVLGPIEEKCPASILRTHNAATLYCDKDSAALLLESDIA